VLETKIVSDKVEESNQMHTVIDQRRRLQYANDKHQTKLQMGVIRSAVSNQVTEIVDLDIQHVFD
jgi:hypothetical protein